MVDTQGNRLGPRKTFIYENDAGLTLNIQLDESVATAVGNVASTNGALPIVCPSKYLEPRYINLKLKTDLSVNKRVVIGDPANSLFASSAASEVTINSQIWVVTSRVGEKRQTLLVDDPPPP